MPRRLPADPPPQSPRQTDEDQRHDLGNRECRAKGGGLVDSDHLEKKARDRVKREHECAHGAVPFCKRGEGNRQPGEDRGVDRRVELGRMDGEAPGAGPCRQRRNQPPRRLIEPGRAVRGEADGPGKIAGASKAAAIEKTADPADGQAEEQAWRDAVLVCDPANNLIIADKLIPQGAGFTATRLLPETEALASRDNFFRPVHLSFMPDGAVMVCDFYREAIETPLSLPDDLKARMGLESKEKGRLWRLAPIGKPPQALEALPLEWAQRLPWLGDDNPWRRFTAHRLVLEEHSPAVVDSLRAMAANEPRSLARVHALSL